MEKTIIIIFLSCLICVLTAVCLMLAEQVRRERERARKEVTETKTQFLSRVSNDIKTPMNVIIGAAALGMEEMDDAEKMWEYLARVHTAARFLMGILNDLVDMSKIQTGKFRLHMRAVAFGAFMEEIRMMIEPQCRKKQIAFRMPQEDISISLMADPVRFPQIFLNLLNNAVKFTPKGGEVQFRVCNYATHNNLFSADYVVKDTGIGMSEEFQKLLFEPFTQAGEVIAEQQNGAGLGLAITRNIVDLMGGTIEVRSELGAGTEIKVHLDVELAIIQPDGKGRLQGSVSRAVLKGKRVLLVEDHPMNVEISRHILEKQKMEVESAESGREALALFGRAGAHYFDIILMDICMPEMDGLETAGKIRRMQQADAQLIPIIAMSASDAPEDVDACREAGMNAHIAKPVEPKELYRVLCEYLEQPV